MFSKSKSQKSQDLGKCKYLVLATDITLDERFGALPSRNPLRPNLEAKTKRTVAAAEPDDEDEDVINNSNKRFIARKPFRNLELLNKLSGARDPQDLEILRLRAQLRAAQLRLNTTNARRGRPGRRGPGGRAGAGEGVLRLRLDDLPKKGPRGGNILKRIGGGISFQHGGKSLTFRGEGALRQFLSNGMSPMKRRSKGKAPIPGSGASKDDLDKELDAYMSKSKTKQKSTLDQELDEIMAERARSLAERGTIVVSTQPTTTAAASSQESAPITTDVEMEDDIDSEVDVILNRSN